MSQPQTLQIGSLANGTTTLTGGSVPVSPAITVQAGVPGLIVLDTNQPEPFVTSGTTTLPTTEIKFTVDVTDSNHNLIPSGSASISDSIGGSKISPTNVSFVNGVLSLDITGLPVSNGSQPTQTLTVTVGGASYKTPSFTVDPVFDLSNPTTIVAGTPFSLTVTARDGTGRILTGFTGYIKLTSNAPRAANLDTFALTAADKGVLTIKGLVFEAAGNRTLTVQSGQFAGTGTIAVLPAAKAKLVMLDAPGTATVGTHSLCLSSPRTNTTTSSPGTMVPRRSAIR